MKHLHRTPCAALAIASLALVLGGCGEKPQTAGTQVHGGATWKGANARYNAPGWKPGDQASWDEQIKQRNRQQNEYVRLTP